jgi:hypothetical protein
MQGFSLPPPQSAIATYAAKPRMLENLIPEQQPPFSSLACERVVAGYATTLQRPALQIRSGDGRCLNRVVLFDRQL